MPFELLMFSFWTARWEFCSFQSNFCVVFSDDYVKIRAVNISCVVALRFFFHVKMMENIHFLLAIYFRTSSENLMKYFSIVCVCCFVIKIEENNPFNKIFYDIFLYKTTLIELFYLLLYNDIILCKILLYG